MTRGYRSTRPIGLRGDAPAELRVTVGGGVAEARGPRPAAGSLDEAFVQTVVDALETYLEPPNEE